MADNHSSLFFFLSLVLFISNCSRKVEMVYALEEKSVNLDNHMHVITLSSLTPADVCYTPTEGSKISSKLQLASKYGACSPLKYGSTTAPSLSEILLKDQARIKYLHSKKAGTNLAVDYGVSLTAYYGSGEFLVTIGLGTPEQTATVIMDTGSDLAWVQCLPCEACLSQEGSYFNPADSSTYANVACGSTTCDDVLSATSAAVPCTTDCLYFILYGDYSSTEGNLATDTLTLSSSAVFSNYIFGCGSDQVGDFGGADGILGLGRNEYSVVYQTAGTYGEYFSYCLPSTSSYTGYLAFGSQADAASSGYTPLLTDSSDPAFYYVNLTGIYVGGELLDVAASVYTSAGTIIDSGTTLTYLPTTAYSALVSAFKEYMTEYESVPPTEGLEDCYNLAGYTSVTVPSIVLQFTGYDLDVASSGILYQVSSDVYCLAFSSSSSFSIFGNTQQLTYEVSYNVAGGELGFTPQSCS